MNFEKLGQKLDNMSKRGFVANFKEAVIFGCGAMVALLVINLIPLLSELFTIIGLGTVTYGLYRFWNK